MNNPPRTVTPLGSAELDVASTLINEANAILRLHGEDPNNDGTGDDLPVLTEVIFDLGEPTTPRQPPARPNPAAAAPATPSGKQQPAK
ncbi:MAG: hypothetical protein FWD51_03625, partial [Betaproteobacteria bacterium]|nr:hypothetical protein [Betaproteobacteria bacterium]